MPLQLSWRDISWIEAKNVFLKQAANRFISAAKLGILTTALIEIVSLLEPASSCHSRNVFCYFCTGFNSQNSRCKTLRRGSLMPCWVWVVVLPQLSVLELQQRRKMLTIFLPLPPFLPVFLSFCSTGSNILRNSPTLNVFFFSTMKVSGVMWETGAHLTWLKSKLRWIYRWAARDFHKFILGKNKIWARQPTAV